MARKRSVVEETLEKARNVQTEAIPKAELPDGFVERQLGNPLNILGAVVHGQYIGKGKPMKMEGQKKPVATYQIRTKDGFVQNLLASAQLESFFDGVEGNQWVWIQRVGQTKNRKGQPVNQFRFAVLPQDSD